MSRGEKKKLYKMKTNVANKKYRKKLIAINLKKCVYNTFLPNYSHSYYRLIRLIIKFFNFI